MLNELMFNFNKSWYRTIITFPLCIFIHVHEKCVAWSMNCHW